MAINKLTTIPKHLMIDPAHPLPPNSVTYPGTGGNYGTYAVPVSMGGVSISNGTIPPPNLTEHTIQGSMLTVSKIVDHYVMEQLSEDEIKISMIGQLVEEIIRNKCVEFTKQRNEINNETVIRARIFVTPDTNVRIIREMQK